MNSDDFGGLLLAGQLAKLCGISTDTLRHYERIGVLPKPRRTAAGYRKYPQQAAARVQLVRRALSVGFTLPELARILTVRDGGGAPCRQVRALAAAKLAAVEQQIESLNGLRETLRALLADWDRRLDQVPLGAPARLLEALADSPFGKGTDEETGTRGLRRR